VLIRCSGCSDGLNRNAYGAGLYTMRVHMNRSVTEPTSTLSTEVASPSTSANEPCGLRGVLPSRRCRRRHRARSPGHDVVSGDPATVDICTKGRQEQTEHRDPHVYTSFLGSRTTHYYSTRVIDGVLSVAIPRRGLFGMHVLVGDSEQPGQLDRRADGSMGWTETQAHHPPARP
jgi:hypothetical protein